MGVEQTPNKSQHTKLTLEKKILPPLLLGFKLTTLDHEFGALANKLSWLPVNVYLTFVAPVHPAVNEYLTVVAPVHPVVNEYLTAVALVHPSVEGYPTVVVPVHPAVNEYLTVVAPVHPAVDG